MPKLTKRTVDALKPRPGRDLVVFDSELSGFGVRVKPSGRRSYLVQYRNAGGRSRRVTIAGHGRMTAEEARAEAKQLLAAAERGQDPAEDRRRALRAPTVAQLAALYLERHARPRKKTAIADESMLRRYILPALGTKKVEAITQHDVAQLHHDLGDKPLAANRVLALVSVMFNLAEAWGLRAPASNPCRHLKRYPEHMRERADPRRCRSHRRCRRAPVARAHRRQRFGLALRAAHSAPLTQRLPGTPRPAPPAR